MFAEERIADFLQELGSDAPVPGGGGAAALAGAEAAGLVTMVARLTAGKEAFASIESRVQQIIAQGDQKRQILLEAIDQDAAAFQALMNSYRLPRTLDEEKATRTKAIQAGLRAAIDSPMAIARECAALVELAAELAETANPHAITDAGTAAHLAEAALLGAILQARINLKSVKDLNYAENTRAEISRLIESSRHSRERAIAAVEKHLN